MIRHSFCTRSLTLTLAVAALLGRCAMTHAAPQDSQDSLTLKETLRLVLARNPSLAQAAASLEATCAHAQTLGSYYYPTVNGILSYADIGPIFNIALTPGSTPFQFYPANNYDGHISVDYTLLDFGKRGLSVEAGKVQEAMAGDRLQNAKISLSYLVMNIFNTIILLQKGIEVNDEQIATLDRHLQVVKEKSRTGSATEFDTLTTAVQHASAQSQRISLANSLSKQRIALQQLLGFPLGVPLFLKGDFGVGPLELSADSLIGAAFENRSDRKLAQHSIAAAQVQVQSAKLENYPVLSAFATAGIKNGYIQSFTDQNLNEPVFNWTAGGRLTFPIFDGFRQKNSFSEAKSNERAAASGLSEVEERIRTEVLQAKSDVEAALAQVDLSSLKVKQAARSFELARIRFETGAITNIDLLDEQNKYVEAEYAHIQNRYQYVLSLLGLDKATGRMPDPK